MDSGRRRHHHRTMDSHRSLRSSSAMTPLLPPHANTPCSSGLGRNAGSSTAISKERAGRRRRNSCSSNASATLVNLTSFRSTGGSEFSADFSMTKTPTKGVEIEVSQTPDVVVEASASGVTTRSVVSEESINGSSIRSRTTGKKDDVSNL